MEESLSANEGKRKSLLPLRNHVCARPCATALHGHDLTECPQRSREGDTIVPFLQRENQGSTRPRSPPGGTELAGQELGLNSDFLALTTGASSLLPAWAVSLLPACLRVGGTSQVDTTLHRSGEGRSEGQAAHRTGDRKESSRDGWPPEWCCPGSLDHLQARRSRGGSGRGRTIGPKELQLEGPPDWRAALGSRGTAARGRREDTPHSLSAPWSPRCRPLAAEPETRTRTCRPYRWTSPGSKQVDVTDSGWVPRCRAKGPSKGLPTAVTGGSLQICELGLFPYIYARKYTYNFPLEYVHIFSFRKRNIFMNTQKNFESSFKDVL